VLELDVLVERTLRPIRLLAVLHLALIMPLDLRSDPPDALLALLIGAVVTVAEVIDALLSGQVVLPPNVVAYSAATCGH